MTTIKSAPLSDVQGERVSKHTPGPWFMHDFADPAVSSNPSPQDITVSCTTPDHITVAFMGNALTATLEEARANARLIAASPTMYTYILAKAEKGDVDAARIIANIG